MFTAILLGALAAPSPAPSAEITPPRTHEVVIEHAGDLGLRDKLIGSMDLWFDAGDFLVGAADRGLVRTLRERKIVVIELSALQRGEGLFLYDARAFEAPGPPSARPLYRHGRQVLAATPPSAVTPQVGLLGPVAIERRAIQPQRPLAVDQPAAGGAKAVRATDPRIQAMVDQVSKAQIESTNASLAANFSRNSTVPSYIDAARDQLIAQLQGYGLSPTTQFFSSNHGDNVLVEIPGARLPNEWVVMGAHYDSINSSGSGSPAPGADDNASGSAAIMELARVLPGGGPYERSLRFIWFAGEEYGLHGSAANAASSKAAGQDIVGMLNMDMCAYREAGDVRDCDWATNNTSGALTAFCDATAAAYVANWASTSGTLTAGSSDHASYTAEGYPAVFPFEDLSQYCPYIHSSNDSYPQATNDFDLSQMITRGVLASAAVLADPLDLEILHTPLSDTQTDPGPYDVVCQVNSLTAATVSAVDLHYTGDGGQNWYSTAMSGAGNTYTGQIPGYGSPVSIQYYITATDSQGGYEVLPEGADSGAPPFEFMVGVRTEIYFDDFEGGGAGGWTHGQVATQDDWQKGAPQGQSGDPGSAWSGSQCWGNDLGPSGWNGAYQNNVNNWLRSPVVDCSAASNVHLDFRRWLTVEAGVYDQAQVKVNGQVVWQNATGQDHVDGSWTKFTLDVSTIAAGNSSVQVEYRLLSDGGVVFGGWNLDDFGLISLDPISTSCPTPVVYCTAKLNSQMCMPAIGFSGEPSVTSPSPFDISASEIINNKNGILFYGFAPNNLPFQGGTLCVLPPTKRTPVQNSGGNPPPNDCSGTFSYDFNALIQSGTDPGLVLAAQVFAQYWFRDPGDLSGFGTGLTDALEFEICP